MCWIHVGVYEEENIDSVIFEQVWQNIKAKPTSTPSSTHPQPPQTSDTDMSSRPRPFATDSSSVLSPSAGVHAPLEVPNEEGQKEEERIAVTLYDACFVLFLSLPRPLLHLFDAACESVVLSLTEGAGGEGEAGGRELIVSEVSRLRAIFEELYRFSLTRQPKEGKI